MLDITQNKNIPVLRPYGRFEADTVSPVRSWLEEHQSLPNIVVDLSNVTFMDATALATLVQAMKQCRLLKGDLYLAGCQPAVKLIMELARLDRVFGIFPDVPAAVAAFTTTTAVA